MRIRHKTQTGNTKSSKTTTKHPRALYAILSSEALLSEWTVTKPAQYLLLRFTLPDSTDCTGLQAFPPQRGCWTAFGASCSVFVEWAKKIQDRGSESAYYSQPDVVYTEQLFIVNTW